MEGVSKDYLVKLVKEGEYRLIKKLQAKALQAGAGGPLDKALKEMYFALYEVDK
jgi:hypothetical protein